MRQHFFFILAMAACVYMCGSIIFWPNLIQSQAEASTWVEVGYYACPWLLVWLSIKGWYQSFVWRRMAELRQLSPTLSRGAYRFDIPPKRSSILERLSLIFLLVALWALWEVWL